MKALGLLGSLLVIAATYVPLCDRRWTRPVPALWERSPLGLQDDHPVLALVVLARAFASAVLAITNRPRALWGTAAAILASVLYVIGPPLVSGEAHALRSGVVTMMAGISALIAAAVLRREPERRL